MKSIIFGKICESYDYLINREGNAQKKRYSWDECCTVYTPLMHQISNGDAKRN